MAGIIWNIGFVSELENVWTESTSHGPNGSRLVHGPWWTESVYPFGVLI
jgi:hypothetical protein